MRHALDGTVSGHSIDKRDQILLNCPSTLTKEYFVTTQQNAVSTKPPLFNIQFWPCAQPDGKGIEIINPSETRIRYACGHEAPDYFEISLYGAILGMNRQNFQRDWCTECALKKSGLDKTIRCSQCGRPIQLSDGIALYPDHPNADQVGWTSPYVLIQEKRNWIGCLSMSCCPSGGYFAGNFTTEGIKLRF